MFKLLSLLIGLILFFVLGYQCINKKTAPAIQDDIQERAVLALRDADMSAVNVNADGRDLTLSGTVNNERQRIAAEQAAGVKWVSTIDNQIVINTASAGYFFDAQKDTAKKVILKGYVANTKSHHDLVSYVMKSHDNPVITDSLEKRGNSPEDWSAVVKSGMDSLKLLKSGQLTIKDKELKLSGETVVARHYVQIDEMLSKSLPAGYEKSLDINFIPQASTKDKTLAHNQTANEACRRKISEAASEIGITFETGSAIITSSSSKQLKKLVKMITKCSTLVLNIKGHTDSKGDDKLNMLLSQKRAIAVKIHLMNNGLAKSTITAEGFGETRPIATNKTLAGRQNNRRIEIFVEGSRSAQGFLPAEGSLPADGSLQ